MASSAVDIGRTFGAILLGTFTASGLSGMAIIQCIIYFKLYPRDAWSIKSMVIGSWLLDSIHTIFVFISVWEYFIKFYGVAWRADFIPWPVALSVVITALQTFFVQCFFAHKILKSSQNNWYITAPIVFLALCRLGAACVSTAEMIRLERYSAFTGIYPGWVFTTGLSLSAGVDVLIMLWLCYYLHQLRSKVVRESTMMTKIVNVLMLYTLENGALTCLTALASLITWLTMPENLIFLGLHFVIAKVYANSFLASLNTRKELWKMQERTPFSQQWSTHGSRSATTALHIEMTNSEQTTFSENRQDALDIPRDHSRRGGLIHFRAGSPNLWNKLMSIEPIERKDHRHPPSRSKS